MSLVSSFFSVSYVTFSLKDQSIKHCYHHASSTYVSCIHHSLYASDTWCIVFNMHLLHQAMYAQASNESYIICILQGMHQVLYVSCIIWSWHKIHHASFYTWYKTIYAYYYVKLTFETLCWPTNRLTNIWTNKAAIAAKKTNICHTLNLTS